MGENVARSLQEYLDILDNIVNSIKNKTNDNDSKKENRSILFYRGHSDVNYELVPSLFSVTEHHNTGYHYMDGTSMATPYVTGVAALLLSMKRSMNPSSCYGES